MLSRAILTGLSKIPPALGKWAGDLVTSNSLQIAFIISNVFLVQLIFHYSSSFKYYFVDFFPQRGRGYPPNPQPAFGKKIL